MEKLAATWGRVTSISLSNTLPPDLKATTFFLSSVNSTTVFRQVCLSVEPQEASSPRRA